VPVIVKGDLARYRAVIADGQQEWRFECPGCGTWAALDNDQWLGSVSVDHAADGCAGRYHETHNFAADLEAHLPGDVS
jgi:phage terminase large subunit GpA-like protein